MTHTQKAVRQPVSQPGTLMVGTEDRFIKLALANARAALADGQVEQAWDWLQTMPSASRPAEMVALCLDALSRLASCESRWGNAEDLACGALAAPETVNWSTCDQPTGSGHCSYAMDALSSQDRATA